MPDSLLKQYKQQNNLHQFASDYWTICGILNRKNDLEQLVAWAIRKRLAAPRQLYQRLLIDEDNRLWKYERRSPLATRLAQFAISLNTLLNPQQSRYVKGYASKYRYS